MYEVSEITDRTTWDGLVNQMSGHPLQMWGWGEVKSAHGWSATRLVVTGTAESLDLEPIGVAQVLVRKVPWPFKSIAYVPRGPMCTVDNRAEVLSALADHVKKNYGSIVLSLEPDWTEPLSAPGWRISPHTVLIPRTLILDLTQEESALQSAMSKKTRQYIRKSAKEAIEIRQVTEQSELDKCLEIYQQTAERAGFGIHDARYYHDIHSMLGRDSLVMAAFADGEPIAFLWNALSDSVCFELYGGMNDTGQRLRANYALKWAAIQHTKELGVSRYDMNGLLNDGVSKFKQGFASHEDLLVGTYDLPLSPLYGLWNTALPTAKKVLRKLRK